MRKTELKSIRIFSEDLKKEIVGLIETGHLTVMQASREYGIRSPQTVYLWLYKYSLNLKKGIRMVMEKDSVDDTNLELRKQIKELEAALGRKTLEADLFRTIVDLASEEYKTDLKKNYGDIASNDSKKKK